VSQKPPNEPIRVQTAELDSTPAASPAAGGLSLQFERVSIRLGRAGPGTALDAVDLSVERGEQLAVVGPSGAGKTTLLTAAACALRPDSGRVLIDRQDPWRQGGRNRHRLRGQLFLAPQIPPLPPRQRVVTAVLAGRLPALGFWRSLRSLFYPIDIAGAHAALVPFELADRLFDRVDRLSGGERQRVSLARALMATARLWLLDEPLSGLDPTRATQAVRVMCEHAAQRGVTLMVSMHQVDLALRSFPRVVGLREGSIVFDRPASAVSPNMLQQLYGSADRATPAGAEPQEPVLAPAPVAMYLR
jgi:phosphonate transport system ATP-binding protein